MKLIRFDHQGEQRIGALDGDRIVALHRHDPSFADLGAVVTRQGWARAEKLAGHPADLSLNEVRLLPPVMPKARVFCIGMNYKLHVEEAGLSLPKYPVFVIRSHESLVGHEQALVCPSQWTQFDFEGELAVVIGRACRNVSEAQALDFVGGYTCCNEGSIRDFMLHSPTGLMMKNFDASGSLGPWIVPASTIPDPADLLLRTRLNGREMQRSSTGDMVFSIAHMISYLSQAIKLLPGDIISTGTPSGVGLGRKPPVWMKPGDNVEVEISGIGTLRNHVISDQATA